MMIKRQQQWAAQTVTKINQNNNNLKSILRWRRAKFKWWEDRFKTFNKE